MNKYLDFENDIENIEKLITNLDISKNNFRSEKVKLLDKKNKILDKIYSNLSAWQKVQVARHPNRPHTKDYINLIFENIIYLHGDKKFSDDSAVLGCLGEISGQSVMIIGTEKGNSMESRIKHNFGMAKPEGYRKAQRLVKLGEKFNLPVITFVDTAGAFPGKDAEERGQSESIASSILEFLNVIAPTISIIIGEGGSGGAIGIAASDRVLMLEHSTYSVISPEGCASILWRSTDFSQEAANTLKLTAQDCKKYQIIDEIIPELPGGAHRNLLEQSVIVKNTIFKNIEALLKVSLDDLVKERKQKYLNITSNI